jgi:hypothetical protein
MTKKLLYGGKGVATQFKKGNTRKETRPVGFERICSRDGVILIKVAEENPYTGCKTRYRPKHRVLWEAAHGPIPKGMVVRFKNGDKMQCELRNLECISQALNLRLNTKVHSALPDAFKPMSRVLCELEVKTYGLKR